MLVLFQSFYEKNENDFLIVKSLFLKISLEDLTKTNSSMKIIWKNVFRCCALKNWLKTELITAKVMSDSKSDSNEKQQKYWWCFIFPPFQFQNVLKNLSLTQYTAVYPNAQHTRNTDTKIIIMERDGTSKVFFVSVLLRTLSVSVAYSCRCAGVYSFEIKTDTQRN